MKIQDFLHKVGIDFPKKKDSYCVKKFVQKVKKRQPI